MKNTRIFLSILVILMLAALAVIWLTAQDDIRTAHGQQDAFTKSQTAAWQDVSISQTYDASPSSCAAGDALRNASQGTPDLLGSLIQSAIPTCQP